MQRSLFLAAVAALASSSAFAEGEVTIYGRLNASVENIERGGNDKTWELVNSSSRIGFVGTEDLGGGLKAGFQLEHGFSVDTGIATQGGQFWARWSELNLGSSTLGTVRLGNFFSDAYYATADYVSLHNHDTGTSADALYAYVGRNVNKIAYRSPAIGGAVVHASVSLDEGVPGDEKSYDLAAHYVLGALYLGAGYEKNGDARQLAVSALYGMGPFVFGGYVQRDRDAFIVDGGTRTNVRLAGMYTMGQSEFHVNVGRAGEYSRVDGTDATQWTLGYNRNLSKRTKLYAFITKLDDDSGVYGGDLRSVALGVRHAF